MCAWARVSALPRHFWLGFVVRAPGFGFGGKPATPGWGLGRVCLVTGFGRAPPVLAGVGGVCGGFGPSCTPLFLVWVLEGVASCVRPVRFPPPSGWAPCGVGLCGGCRGWGLSPTLPFCFPGRGGRGVSWPCRVVALFCRPLPVPVLGLLVSVPPSPLVWVASMFFYYFFSVPRLFSGSVCAGVSGVSFSPVRNCSRLGVTGFGWVVPRCSFGGPRGCCLWCCLAGGFARLLGSGCADSWLCVCLLPPFFFFRRARARGWAGVPPLLCCLFVPLFLGGGVCPFLPLPSLG